jgi:WD40 repeat protein
MEPSDDREAALFREALQRAEGAERKAFLDGTCLGNRQALALMDHPSVAKVFDGGATNSGRPYFVMELVKGISIINYCDQQKLSTKDRLKLFIGVCQAIAGTSWYGYAQLWDSAKFQPVATFSGFFMGVHSAAFSPDGTRLATGSDGFEAVKLWDVQSHQELITLEGQGSVLHLTAFSPDGNVLGSKNGAGNILHLWRAPSWAEIAAAEASERREVGAQ